MFILAEAPSKRLIRSKSLILPALNDANPKERFKVRSKSLHEGERQLIDVPFGLVSTINKTATSK